MDLTCIRLFVTHCTFLHHFSRIKTLKTGGEVDSGKYDIIPLYTSHIVSNLYVLCDSIVLYYCEYSIHIHTTQTIYYLATIKFVSTLVFLLFAAWYPSTSQVLSTCTYISIGQVVDQIKKSFDCRVQATLPVFGEKSLLGCEDNIYLLC